MYIHTYIQKYMRMYTCIGATGHQYREPIQNPPAVNRSQALVSTISKDIHLQIQSLWSPADTQTNRCKVTERQTDARCQSSSQDQSACHYMHEKPHTREVQRVAKQLLKSQQCRTLRNAFTNLASLASVANRAHHARPSKHTNTYQARWQEGRRQVHILRPRFLCYSQAKL